MILIKTSPFHPNTHSNHKFIYGILNNYLIYFRSSSSQVRSENLVSSLLQQRPQVKLCFCMDLNLSLKIANLFSFSSEVL
ncbi:hypothetical protein Hanom_Chr01g00039271 [Helianthus anomalus]